MNCTNMEATGVKLGFVRRVSSCPMQSESRTKLQAVGSSSVERLGRKPHGQKCPQAASPDLLQASTKNSFGLYS